MSNMTTYAQFTCPYCEAVEVIQEVDGKLIGEYKFFIFKDEKGKEHGICPTCKSGIVAVLKDLDLIKG